MWRFLAAYPFVRFIIVVFVASVVTFLAFASSELPTRVVFVIFAWPAGIMLWLFPPPCFDEGPGQPPFCEGTPVQLIAGCIGLVATFLFYCLLTSWLLNRYLSERGPLDSTRPEIR